MKKVLILNISTDSTNTSLGFAISWLNAFAKKFDEVHVISLSKGSNDELEKYSKLDFDYFQLYGKYDSNSLLEIKNRFKKKIISSIIVQRKEDIDIYKKIEDQSDIILWDSSGYEKSLSWNYSWIKDIKIKGEKMIAGNITKDKLNELSKMADIVDVSGALETNKVKDINKIKEFVKQLKKINNEN